jgi:predicted AlkP superfamily phosphohydrolase/phosphomutase
MSTKITVLLTAIVLLCGCGDGAPPAYDKPSVIVLGVDGMDPVLAQRFMDEGTMPNMARLVASGTFQPLGTSVPPLSPIAWSDFITGMDAGGHGIFDFLHRDPETWIPYFAMAKTESAEGTKIGKYQIPGSGSMELLRRGEAFWEVLERHGVPATVVRMPVNFPPSGTASRELSGMGTPDITGSPGTFSWYTSVLFAFSGQEVDGGEVYEVWEEDGVVEAQLHGPPNPFLAAEPELVYDFNIYVDPVDDIAKIVVGDEERIVKVGEWTDWVPFEFEMIPTQSLPAMTRFYLRRVRPEFELYAAPLNFDPMNPGTPISTPPEYAAELAEASGRFYTQGMPEDTKAYEEGVLTRDEFLAQAKIAGREIQEQFEHVLADFKGGLLYYYTGNLDQTSHMMYRVIDLEHPKYDAEFDGPYANAMAEVYQEADNLIGYALDHMPEDTLLVVMSDHGFAPFRRTMSLNTWLKENGYLTVKDESLKKDPGLYLNVDKSKTRAYSGGLNGLYLNLKGREKDGIVDPADRDALLAEISEGLLSVIDPATGGPAVTKVYLREEHYKDRGELEIGPDLVIGYAWSYGSSGESSLGSVPAELFEDNDRLWTGDHGMDHETVPGVLLTSRPLKKKATSLKNLAASILAEYGIEGFPSSSAAAE